MKQLQLNWRTLEYILAGSIGMLAAIIGVSRIMSSADISGHRFAYTLLTVSNILLIYLAYVWLNRLVVPLILKIFRRQKAAQALGLVLLAALQLLLLSYLLGPVINFASFYFAPGFSDFAGFPLTFGFHPQPFLNFFGGMDVSLTMAMLFLLYALLRETVLRLLTRSRADLQSLRSQINPHFLFNALNTLYATALMEKASATATGVQQLGDMMRFMLNDNQRDLIPMSRELDYLGNYIALQKLRTQQLQGILIEDNLAGQQCSQQIAPMLLIPSVENAFKHGISLREPSWIKIRLDCTTNAIHFEVRNSIHPALANDPEKDKSGIGLENVKERLLHQYPGQHEFVYGVTGNEFVVTLTIQTR